MMPGYVPMFYAYGYVRQIDLQWSGGEGTGEID
jgi:hypothetical protein